ncbi:AAA family ATPase [Nocardioides ganghwensis]|uniref:Nuclease SbcCD subunit C n=1 Tax=Nocardioides ganghwensis TaxID=252230 RepID=A0A4Q2SFF1_9ACTN|nr:SMC family ATPase [Nocardioides ganghwensis]MBD3946192.1 SMC family ATPase [Nocardioides ganghwensis]RYC03471.1 SMC family ATPase [Nocardioides ganghwensis]
MRLHHLEIVAFGPFADPVSIDFDTLSDAGLFLLSGPTGAGKSSVLDAVCFALYGDVPGDRAVAKRLRSDHAAPDVVPRVVLEVTLSGRRFRIDRSPAWVRPKKRGTGTTTEQARVVISEHRAERGPGAVDGDDTEEGAWQPLSTRLDETGHLVTRLVGMTLPQFCQVAMLPQGRFQAFLRARSEERHALLQQVFQTGRFDRTERWLRDRRVELRRTSEEHRATVADLVSRISEVGGDVAPEDWPGDPRSLDAWLAGLTEAAVAASVEQAVVVEAAAAAEVAAAEASAAGIELAGLRATHAAARRAWAAIEAAAQEHASRKRRADKARRATAVLSLHELAAQSRADVVGLERDCAAALATLVDLLDDPPQDAQAVAELGRTATRALTDIARVRPLQRQALDLHRQLARTTRARAATDDELRRVDDRAVAVPHELAELAPALEAAREAVAATDALARDLEVLHVRIRAARTAETLTSQLDSAQQSLAEATAARLLARETLVEIREQRLDGMAAEIALKLAVGACCPVCGSAEHPSPASPAPGAPDDATEREARREADDLEVVVEAHAQQVRGLETRLAAALAESGESVERLLVEEEGLLARLERARTLGATVGAHAARVAELEAEQDALTREREELSAALVRHDTEAAVLASRLDDLRDQIAAVVPSGADAADGADLDALTAHHQQVEALAQRHADLTADLLRARATAASTQAAADEVAATAGFDSSAAAAAAWLAEDELAGLLQAIERHEREVARVSELLADDDLVRSAGVEPPDLEALAQAHHRAKEQAAAARHRDMGLRDRGRRLRGLSEEMTSALAAWEPVLADLDLVTDVAAMVEGKHADNRLQMRLSAYVLAHRLGQVVDAANLRLSTMSDQRYSLVHTGSRGAGETRGGLSLLVRDDWTGDNRDPATLSGGETFVVSLALALGLADVITDEAGGTDLETLFVDEGFGSLDAETLEGVMDTLDTLRDGGRVVGVVSHVPELQTRIPTQLRVHRGRTGSHTTLSLA